MAKKRIKNIDWLTQLKQLIPGHGKKFKTVTELAVEISALNLATGANTLQAEAARVRRNIKKLKEQSPGCIAEITKDGQSAYRWSEAASLSLTGISAEELIAMGVLQKYGTDLISRRVRRVLEPYFERTREELKSRALTSGLSEVKAERTVADWLSRIAVIPDVLPFRGPEVKAEVEEMIHEGLFRQIALSLWFKKKPRTRGNPGLTVSPLGIAQQGVRTYLIALDNYAHVVKRFLIHRIESVDRARDDHKTPKDWDLNAFLRKGIGKPQLPEELHDQYGMAIPMKLWVDSDTQWIKETPFYAEGSAAKITDNADRSYFIEADIVLTEELIRWLLSMGYHVKVIEPAWLADRIMFDIQKALEMYREAL